MGDRVTLYKSSPGYYTIHKENLLKAGYKIEKDDKEKTIFTKEDNSLINKETYEHTPNT